MRTHPIIAGGPGRSRDPGAEPGASTQWVALALSFFATVAMYISYVGYTSQTPQIMADLNINYGQAGWLASVSTLSGGAVVVFAAMLIGKIGTKAVLLLGMAALILGQLVFGLGSTYPQMLLARIIIGAGIALLFVAPYTLAMQWFAASDRLGMAMGVMLSTDGLGTVVAIYLFPAMLAAFDWQQQQLIAAAILLACAILFAIFLKEPSQDDNEPKPSFMTVAREYIAVIRHRNVVSSALFLSGIWASYSVAAFWIPTLLIEDAGWSAGSAGLVGSLYSLVGMATAVGFGLYSDRIGKRRPFILISGVGITISMVLSTVFLSTGSYLLFALSMPLAGLFAYIGLPLSYVLAADQVGIKLAASANGFALGIGLVCGATAFPLLVGMIRDATGSYTTGFVVTAVSQLVLCVLAPLFLAREIKTLAQP